jgi:Na+/proline symporter
MGNGDNTLFMIVFFAFLAIYLIVTLFMGRKGVSLADYYVMDRSGGPWLIAGTYTATWISAVGMVGLAGMSYKTGPLTGILDWGAYTGFILSAFWIGNKLRRFGQVTLGDFFGDRFDSQFIRALSAIATILGLGAYFVGQIIGSAIITETLLGIPYNVMVTIMVIVFVVIALVAGAKSVTVTDTIMLGIIGVCLGYVFSPWLISVVGIQRFADYAKENPVYFTAGGGVYAWGTIIGWQVLWGLGNAANPAAITRAYLAKDSRTWVQAIIIAFILTMSVVWLSHMAASGVYLVNPNLPNPGAALTWGAMNIVPPIVGALAIAGLFGACLSTASTQILVLAFSVSRDLYEKIYAKNASEKTLLRVARVWVIIFGLLGAMFALGKSSLIVQIGNYGSSIFSAAFFPVLFLGLNWRNFTREAAIASMLTGMVMDTALHLGAIAYGQKFGSATYLPYGIHAVIWSVIAAMLVAYGVSQFTKPTEKQLAVYDVCNTPMADEISTSKSTMKKFVAVMAVYAVVQTVSILWFAGKIG